MRQETTLDKRNRGKCITDCDITIRARDMLYPLLMQLTKTKVKCRVILENTYTPLPDRPIVFAANHSAFMDTPIMERVTKRRSYILSGRQSLPFVDWLFFALIGSIWVDRKSGADMKASKDAIIEYLQKGQSVLWFPEGTWNLTDNLLVMPLKWGIVEIAKQANAQIIPVVLRYDRAENICQVKFGQPITDMQLENKVDAIRNLRDAMATLRWDLLSREKLYCHADIAIIRDENYRAVEEYPYYDFDYEQSCVYRPHDSYEDVFEHLRFLKPCKENAFLLRKQEGTLAIQ